jgi:hypothetical protein
VFTLATFLVQVSVRPLAIVPAQHERIAVQVANPSSQAIVAVRVLVPSALAILGVDAPPGWSARHVVATDTTPQAVEWTGGSLGPREFREFAFLARLPADARRETLVFPIRARTADGVERAWEPGGVGPAPTVQIEGSIGVTSRGAFVLAAGALGLAGLAVALALRRR